MFGKILVAVGGDDASLEPARVGGRLAAQLDAELTLLCVDRPPADALGEPYYTRIANKRIAGAKAILASARGAAIEAGATRTRIERVEGEPVERILEMAKLGGYDLLIMGRRRMGRVAKALLGSVSAEVASRTTIPLVITPEPTAQGEQTGDEPVGVA